EVQVFDTREGRILVGVIELVSPGNKDRPEARASFAAKCAAYLQKGIGVVVIDIVTDRRANLHNDLMRLLEQEGDAVIAAEGPHAASYRPVRRGEQNLLDAWNHQLRIGDRLPVVLLPLRGKGVFELDLEETYTIAFQNEGLD